MLRNFEQLKEHEVCAPHEVGLLQKARRTASAIRRKNPFVAGSLEVLVMDLYDYYELVAGTSFGTSAFTFFAIAQNQQYTPTGAAASFAKKEYHTNVTGQGAQLPNQQSHLTKFLQHIVRPDAVLLDFQAIEYQAQVDFVVGDKKTYYESMLARIPSGSGTQGIGTPATNLLNLTQGWPDSHNGYSLLSGEIDPNTGIPDRGVPINQGQQFKVVLDATQVVGGPFTAQAAGGATLGTGIKVWMYLCGVLWRGVQ